MAIFVQRPRCEECGKNDSTVTVWLKNENSQIKYVCEGCFNGFFGMGTITHFEEIETEKKTASKVLVSAS